VFSWNAASQARQYYLEVATDAGFVDVVYSAWVDDTSATSGVALQPLSTYFWRVYASNTCGEGAVSSTFSFTTADIPPILLVDDDDNGPDVRAYYEDTLTALGLDYDVWDTNNTDNEPTAVDLAPYQAVIWFSGDEFGGFAGPGANGEAALATWLDGGETCLFLSSQDYHWDRGLTSFMTGYLGVGNIADDNGGYTSVTGAGSVYGGLGPYTLSYPFTDYSDTITPGNGGELAFDGNNGRDAGVDKAGGYHTTFLAYPLEAKNQAGRTAVLNAFFNACEGGAVQDMVVYRIKMKLTQGGNGVGARVYIVDGSGNLLEGATVDIDWTLPDSSVVSASSVTNALGRVQFSAPDGGSGLYTITVTGVTKPGYLWTGGNQTEKSIVRP